MRRLGGDLWPHSRTSRDSRPHNHAGEGKEGSACKAHMSMATIPKKASTCFYPEEPDGVFCYTFFKASGMKSGRRS
jgi:hypothetical protein